MKQEAFPFPSETEEAVIDAILYEVKNELFRALRLYTRSNSLHGAHSILREEFEELWDEVKKKAPNKARVTEEAVQTAAMAVRLILEHGDIEHVCNT